MSNPNPHTDPKEQGAGPSKHCVTVELEYVVLLEPDDGAHNVIIPALPEAHTWGKSVEHALEMARDVIALALAERRSRGEDLPPSDVRLTP
jgi:predicted RNase H-like HicB family nuclease